MSKPKSFQEILTNMTDAFTEATNVEDVASGTLTASILNHAAAVAAQNFGQANHIFMSPQSFNIMTHMGWSQNPEYTGLPWEMRDRLTKRERKFADLHRLLFKLKVSNNEENNTWTVEKSVKRLKRAKWAKVPRKPFNPVIKPQDV